MAFSLVILCVISVRPLLPISMKAQRQPLMTMAAGTFTLLFLSLFRALLFFKARCFPLLFTLFAPALHALHHLLRHTLFAFFLHFSLLRTRHLFLFSRCAHTRTHASFHASFHALCTRARALRALTLHCTCTHIFYILHYITCFRQVRRMIGPYCYCVACLWEFPHTGSYPRCPSGGRARNGSLPL